MSEDRSLIPVGQGEGQQAVEISFESALATITRVSQIDPQGFTSAESLAQLGDFSQAAVMVTRKVLEQAIADGRIKAKTYGGVLRAPTEGLLVEANEPMGGEWPGTATRSVHCYYDSGTITDTTTADSYIRQTPKTIAMSLERQHDDVKFTDEESLTLQFKPAYAEGASDPDYDPSEDWDMKAVVHPLGQLPRIFTHHPTDNSISGVIGAGKPTEDMVTGYRTIAESAKSAANTLLILGGFPQGTPESTA